MNCGELVQWCMALHTYIQSAIGLVLELVRILETFTDLYRLYLGNCCIRLDFDIQILFHECKLHVLCAQRMCIVYSFWILLTNSRPCNISSFFLSFSFYFYFIRSYRMGFLEAKGHSLNTIYYVSNIILMECLISYGNQFNIVLYCVASKSKTNNKYSFCFRWFVHRMINYYIGYTTEHWTQIDDNGCSKLKWFMDRNIESGIMRLLCICVNC